MAESFAQVTQVGAEDAVVAEESHGIVTQLGAEDAVVAEDSKARVTQLSAEDSIVQETSFAVVTSLGVEIFVTVAAEVFTGTAAVLADRGAAERMVLYRLDRVPGGSSFDVGDHFDEVKAAVFVAAGVASAGVGTVTGTTVVMDGPSDDDVYLIVVGQASVNQGG